MSGTLQTLSKNLLTFIRANVSDPLSRGVSWIYIDYPRTIKTLPMISITNIGSDRSEIGVGDQGSRIDFIFSIEVFTSSTAEATISGSRYAGPLLRDYLADLVLTAFVDNRQYLKDTYLIQDAIISRIDSAPFDVGKDIYRKMLTLTVTIDKGIT